MSIATNTPLPTLIFAMLATLAVSGCAVGLDLDDDTTRRIENDVVPVGQLTRVDVTTDNGQIEVTSGAVDEIEIRSVMQEVDEGDAEYSIETDGDRLVLIGECDSVWWQRCSVGFRVTVPGDFDVDVATDNGRVSVVGIAGDVDIETDNGAIEADRLDAEQVNARTDNGRIRVVFDSAPMIVDARTDNGAIAIRVPGGDDGYDVDAGSDSGSVDVDVRTDPAAERHLTARSDNGAIDVGYLSVDN